MTSASRPFSGLARAVLFAAAALAASGAFTAAHAVDVTTSAGTAVMVANFHGWTSQCRTRPIEVAITRQPKNGTVSITKSTATIERAFRGNAGTCAGTTVGSQRVVYTPKAGFRGSDAFSLSTGNPGQVRKVGHRFNITVR